MPFKRRRVGIRGTRHSTEVAHIGDTMSRTIKNIFGFVFAGLFILGISPALVFAQTGRTEASLSEERSERLSDVLQDYVDTERIPGVVALVAHRGQVAYLEAFGFRDREAGALQRTDDIFPYRLSNEGNR